MKTEQEKYLDALHKAIDFKKALDELQPENQKKLFQDLLGVASIQEVRVRLWAMMEYYGKIR